MKSYLCALALACLMPFSAHASVTFVSDHEELATALEMHAEGKLESLAVQYEYFHSGTAKQQRDAIRRTMAVLLATNGIAVYVYGPNLPASVFAELGITRDDRVSCSPLVIRSLMRSGQSLVHGCGADSGVSDEATLRKQVIDHGADLRKHLPR